MDESAQMTIGELAAKTDVTPRTIRFYVAEGLLPPGEGFGNQRVYGYEHLLRLRLIRLLQAEDLPLRRIKAKLEGLSVSEMRDLARLGAEMSARAAKGRPFTPRQMLEAVLVSDAPAPGPARLRPASGRPTMLRNVVPDAAILEQSQGAAGLWRKVPIAPGVELLYEVTDDQKRTAKIQKIIQDAAGTLSDAPDSGKTRD